MLNRNNIRLLLLFMTLTVNDRMKSMVFRIIMPRVSGHCLILLISCFANSSTLEMETVSFSDNLSSLWTTIFYNQKTIVFIVTAVRIAHPTYNCKMIDKLWIGKNSEGNGHARISVTSWHFPGGIEGCFVTGMNEEYYCKFCFTGNFAGAHA
jgi:hypothetical protein